MASRSEKGSVITVEGPIDPTELGTTLTHEHIFIDMENWFVSPDSVYERSLSNQPLSLENLWFVRRNPFMHKDNLILDSIDEACDELAEFYRAGGNTIIDVTPKNVGGDPRRVRKVGRATGVQIVHGTSFYVENAHPKRIERMSIDDIEQEFVSDIETGIDETDVRAGIIGELGTSGQIHDQEEKVLRAGARAALRSGAPVSVHTPGTTNQNGQNMTRPSSWWGLKILDILEDEGLPPERAIMCHMDRTLFENVEHQLELAERGAYLEYDLWGTEAYRDSIEDGYPSDTWRVTAVDELLKNGYESQLLFSHDVAMKIRLQKYGGFGYAHILENIVPMLKDWAAWDVAQEQIDQILVENPKNVLTFDDPK
jgi:phosphotriesterase-related protein